MTVSWDAIAEFAQMTREHPNEIVYAEYVELLLAHVAAVEESERTLRDAYERALNEAQTMLDFIYRSRNFHYGRQECIEFLTRNGYSENPREPSPLHSHWALSSGAER